MKRHFQILERFRRSLLAGQQLHESVPSSHVKNLREISALSSSEVFEKLQSNQEGLTQSEAHHRLHLYGHNVVATHQKQHSLLILLSKFKEPLVVMLLILALINLVYIQDLKSASVIGAMTLISVVLSFMQEIRSGKAAEKLNAMVSSMATVGRNVNGNTSLLQLPISMLVPGDIVHLGAGDIIAVDMRILTSKELFVNQSTLTGEAMPVEKNEQSNALHNESIFDLSNMCYRGSHVESGSAVGIVVQTGKKTYLGSIATMLEHQPSLTTFDRGIKKFTWMMITFMLIMTPVVIVINGLLKHDWAEAFLFGLSVAVGLAPEMLPMIVTVNLAKGAMRLSQKKVIVKNLQAIQNFGAMDVLCTDKTGTLTQDKIILERHIDVAGNENAHVLELAYINSHYQTGLKNLLDMAILQYVQYEKLQKSDYVRKIDEIPFDFSRKRMSVVVENNASKKHLMITKGAVEEIITLCHTFEHRSENLAFDAFNQECAFQTVKRLNEEGFRVIAIASKEVDALQRNFTPEDECDLTLNGFIAFLDPAKEGVKEALDALHGCGVAVKVLTGDNEVVTRKICHDVGLMITRVYKGSDIDTMSDKTLKIAVEEANIFVKLSPSHKARIVEALNHNGHTTGFLGDGINDASALQMADVGLSVDTAVDIAKESADMILLEKSLLVLQQGVISGREVFGNIIKYIKMSASSNFGNMFSVLGASLFLSFLPMRPIQILTNNFLYDLSQSTTPTDNVDPEFIAKPRKWDIGGLRNFMLVMGPVSSLFDYILFAVMLYIFQCWENPSLFQTGWFVESLVSQTMIVHILRTNKLPFIRSVASVPVLIMTSFVMLFGMFLPYSPFAQTLGFQALPMLYWFILLMMMLAYIVLAQSVKQWYSNHYES